MMKPESEFIDVAQLRVGHYVFIDLGWISHPFPLNSFKIQSVEQIAVIRSLGLERIRYSPERSDADAAEIGARAVAAAASPQRPEDRSRALRRELLAQQRARLQACERNYAEAARASRVVTDLARAQPEQARRSAETAVGDMVGGLLAQHESCIQLLADKLSERGALHSVNTTVLSLLLGKASGFDAAALHELGVAALIHDIGKIDLPARLRISGESHSAAEEQLFQQHVAAGVALGKGMGLAPNILLAVAQHHEYADGSGYPLHLAAAQLAPATRILSLVNHYDNLCNPGNPINAVTPHEALAQIFAQAKRRFDRATLEVFIRMMGVYPPGSIVELADGSHAIVVSVNSTRPLKPRVIVHDPAIPRDEALVVDLERAPELGIRRSLKPVQLPAAAVDYLAPRQRLSYFFDPESAPDPGGGVP